MCAFAAVASATAVAAQGSWSDRVRTLWDAADPSAALVDQILALDPDFDELYDLMSAGPVFAPDVPRGVVEAVRKVGGESYQYSYVVPDVYDYRNAIPVRFMLHGGVATDDRRKGSRGPIENLVRAGEITVLPSAWNGRPWWTDGQIENLSEILKTLKRTYNVDENRVHIGGVSDGAAGVWFMAMTNTTPWSAFLPFIGHIEVLAAVAREHSLYLANLRNKPFLVVNTALDRLYPDSLVRPLMDELRAHGVSVSYHSQPDFGHDTNWFPRERLNIDRFISDNPRRPHPPLIEWATDSENRYGRAHWIEIVRVEASDSGELNDWNRLQDKPLFARDRGFFAVRAERLANDIELETTGIAALKLLLSPDAFDLDHSVRVKADGQLVFDGVVQKSSRVLLEGWIRDRDRRMLYAAELLVELGD